MFDGEKPTRGGEFKGGQFRGSGRNFSRDNRGMRSEFKNASRNGSMASNARDAALGALVDVVRKGAYSSQALDRQLSGSALSSEDKALAASLFYTAAENRLRLEYALDAMFEERPEPVVWDIINIAAAQILLMDRIPDHAAVDEAVKQAKAAGRAGLAGMVNASLRNLIRRRDAGDEFLPDRAKDVVKYMSVRYSVSEFLVEKLISTYGEAEAEAIMAHVPDEHGNTTVRPNLMINNASEFESFLNARGISWKQGLVDGSYIISGAGGIANLEGYRRGYFSIQGQSSMLAAMQVKARPGMNLLDACAAPGGKAAFMAEATMGAGRIYAWDTHPHRVDLIKATARRLRIDNIRASVRDARKPMPEFENMMDGVLVDAPCSGLGVMSDKPDIKYRIDEASISSLLDVQAEILDNCASFVKPGGRLIYSTCTILPEENRDQVVAFLKKHPDFKPDLDENLLPVQLRGKQEDGMLQLLAHRDGVEGFFIAAMRRT